MTAGGSPPPDGPDDAEPVPLADAQDRRGAVPAAVQEALPPKELGIGRLKSRNVFIGGKRSSLRLEPVMWAALEEIAVRERDTVSGIVTRVAQAKDPQASVTGAVRAFIADYFRSAATEDGHRRAGHGSLKGAPPCGLRIVPVEEAGE